MIEILNTCNPFEGTLEVKYKRFVGCVEVLKSRFASPPFSYCPSNSHQNRPAGQTALQVNGNPLRQLWVGLIFHK